MEKFELYENMEHIKDSMQFDSETQIAFYEKDGYIAEIEVRGSVSVDFSPSGFKEDDVQSYHSFSEFPQELKDIIAEGKLFDDDRVYVGENNWFECFINNDEYCTTVNVEGMTADAICQLCKEIIDEAIEQDSRTAKEDTKTYYCVTSSFDDRGHTSAGITSSVEAEEKPESSYTSTSRRDTYNDWFDSYEEAQQFVEDALKENEPERPAQEEMEYE